MGHDYTAEIFVNRYGIWRTRDSVPDFVYLKKGNAELMLEQPGKTRVWKTGEFKYPLGIGINLSIKVEDVDVLYKKINDLKLPIFLPLEEKWYNQTTKVVGNKQFIIQDPDGYLLRFVENLGSKEVS